MVAKKDKRRSLAADPAPTEAAALPVGSKRKAGKDAGSKAATDNGAAAVTAKKAKRESVAAAPTPQARTPAAKPKNGSRIVSTPQTQPAARSKGARTAAASAASKSAAPAPRGKALKATKAPSKPFSDNNAAWLTPAKKSRHVEEEAVAKRPARIDDDSDDEQDGESDEGDSDAEGGAMGSYSDSDDGIMDDDFLGGDAEAAVQGSEGSSDSEGEEAEEMNGKVRVYCTAVYFTAVYC